MNDIGLYIHIPFCVKKCAYCDFPSWAGREALIPAYIETLCLEISRAKDIHGRLVRTVYIGGGTPSCLPPGMVLRIAQQIKSYFIIDENIEWTIEANPGTLTPACLDEYILAGVNRLSLGLQSSHASYLQMLGRIHTPGDYTSAVEMARLAGFRNLSTDLMFGMQTLAKFKQTLLWVMDHKPEHISCYGLIVEPGTALEKRIKNGEIVLPDEDTEADCYALAQRLLPRGGYKQYEISNFAKPGYESRHNLRYWLCEDTWGFGVAAHSLLGGIRYANTDSLEAYMTPGRLPLAAQQVLTTQQQQFETVMLALRTSQGLDADAFSQRFTRPPDEMFPSIGSLLRRGLLVRRGNHLAIPADRLYLQNQILLELMEDGNFI